MRLGFIGLGRMGTNMVYNLLEHKHQVIAYNRSSEPTRNVAKKGAIPAYSLTELLEKTPKPRILWLMVPAGKTVDTILTTITPQLAKGDIIIDGGNSYYKDSQRRYRSLKKKGISYLDCGTSGGITGARHGACMMVGGDKTAFKKTEPLFKAMSVPKGYGYMGKTGAGHFVKMVHNGIEYGMMGALAEGIQAIDKHKKTFGFDLKNVTEVYAHGSIIESRLLSWLLEGMKKKTYSHVSGTVPQGETEKEMQKLEKLADVKVLTQARKMRVHTRKKPSLAGKLIAVMRNEFGGHKVKKK